MSSNTTQDSTLEQRGPELISELLRLTGEDPNRPELLKTPQRFCEAFAFLTAGYGKTVDEVVNGAVFSVDASMQNMVVVKDIQFSSLCEHHLLPFAGVCHVAYLPRDKVLGLSKIPRIVEVFARRLQIQERLGAEIAKAVDAAVDPLGVAVVIEAAHMCMSIRGVEKPGAKTQTSCMLVCRHNSVQSTLLEIPINIQESLQKLRAGFRVQSLVLTNAGNPAEVFFKASEESLTISAEVHFDRKILTCEEVSREIVFSSAEIIKNLRLEQEIRFNNTVLEKHHFRFGFVIPNSTNTWEQTFTAAQDRVNDPDLLSGNIEMMTTFCDGNRLIKRFSLIVYYD